MMGFFGFGKKKEELKVEAPMPTPEETPSAPMNTSQGIPPPVDAAALLPKNEDFPFEHINPLPFEMDSSQSTIPIIEKVEPAPITEMPTAEVPLPEHILNEAPAPEEHLEMNLSELSKQLPIQEVPRPSEEQGESQEARDLSLEIPEDLMRLDTQEEAPQAVPVSEKEVFPEFAAQEFEEVKSPEEEMIPLQGMDHGRFDEPADMGSELLGTDRKVRRFKVTKINGELFVEAESYKFFLENMVTMHEDLRRTNDLFLKYSNENIDEDQLYKKMFGQLNNIHEDLIKIDHQLFERE